MNVQRAFRKNNIQNPLTVAHDGVEGLERLRDGSVPEGRRLVLLDLNMPRMSGIEFLRELRADPRLRNTSVVVLTTSAEDRDRVEAYNLNVGRVHHQAGHAAGVRRDDGDAEQVLDGQRAP